jgi:hypothetical protein
MQSGKVQQYALYFLAGMIGLAVLFIYIWHPGQWAEDAGR